MAVVAGSGTKGFKILAAILQGRQVTAPLAGILASDLTQPSHIVSKAFKLGVHYRVGPKSRNYPTLPATLANLAMVAQIIQRRLCGCQPFDIEFFQQCADR